MPCPHKFADDLNIDKLTFLPTTLIIGTFNPGWQHLPNTAEWFYGRTQNNYFWEVLPRLYGKPSLRQEKPEQWQAFCRNQHIAITDLIYSIADADDNNPEHTRYLQSYRDDLIAKHFQQIHWVNIIGLLQTHPSIKQVYLTRTATSSIWQTQWRSITEYCRHHAINQQTLLTPSGSARFQIPKNSSLKLSDFIFEQWQRNWHEITAQRQST